MKNQSKAYIFALSAVLLWSTVATAFKIALQKIDFIQLLFYSSLVAFLFLLALVSFEKKWALLQQINTKNLLLSLAGGVLNPFLYYLILFKAYAILPAQQAMVLNYIWPVVLVLLSIPILKQKINLLGLFSLLISFLGVMVIAVKGNFQQLHFENAFGISLAIFSSVVWAVFWLLNLKNSSDASIKLLISFGIGALLSAVICFNYSNFNLPNFTAIAAVAYIGLAEMGITFYLWMMALKLSTRTDKVSQLIYLSPIISLYFISLFVNEKLHWSSFVGLFLIVSGIITNNYIKQKLPN